MKRDLFQFLPSEIIINILSRLPVRTIAMSKSVCKPWLDLLSSNDFVNSHLSKSVPALAVWMKVEQHSRCCKVFEFEDEVDDIERRYIPLTMFDFDFSFSFGENILGAVDGLILLQAQVMPYTLYIFNPFTREYVELPCGIEVMFSSSAFGFGVSKITGQHKVVQISRKPESDCGVKCQVYTLETGLWRRFEATAKFHYDFNDGVFVNGNLHWIGGSRSEFISCFDLEMECFSMFSAPPLEETGYNTSIRALKDCLCVCAFMHLSTSEDEYVVVVEIWLMKEYGVEESWTKEYVIGIDFPMDVEDCCFPIKVFKDGDILMSCGELGFVLYHYSVETQTAHIIDMLQGQCGCFDLLLLTPSLLSLKSFGMKNVISI